MAKHADFERSVLPQTPTRKMLNAFFVRDRQYGNTAIRQYGNYTPSLINSVNNPIDCIYTPPGIILAPASLAGGVRAGFPSSLNHLYRPLNCLGSVPSHFGSLLNRSGSVLNHLRSVASHLGSVLKRLGSVPNHLRRFGNRSGSSGIPRLGIAAGYFINRGKKDVKRKRLHSAEQHRV